MNSGKKQKTADLLSICIKAGKTVKGFDSVSAISNILSKFLGFSGTFVILL